MTTDVPDLPPDDAVRAEGLWRLTTEQVDPVFGDIDRLDTLDLLTRINAQDATVPKAVATQLPRIAEAVDLVVEAFGAGGRLVYAGAGTAGRLGVLDASECPPTFDTDPSRVVGLIAGGPTALTTAVEGAEDDRDGAVDDLARLGIGPTDVVVGISASGRTPYAVGAVEKAHRRGARTIGLACNAGSPLGRAADVAIEVVVGPEVVAGSTRLKAGTAQKLVCNMITTGAMVRLGKTYGNLMVDVRATNEKLRDRAHRIVTTATGADDATVTRALADHGGRAKDAVLAILTGWPRDRVDAELERADGVLRAALAAGSGDTTTTSPTTSPTTETEIP
ncbi:N-acetylmuramic acid 6-phosphate etherase [Mobilicoccus pelagius]|uniref:N-acetylmuramic acid 6-phosphate etherase n=1 Tax=Mobilicoccus pelagius NBRC 104925 TaxID=1089455 RepID=H5UMF4_9MICO|nr:N-acetylmuramic acid 6-phosphate etherase [Mobilicoccus pelagius]GAB46912.1 N-acetylmuramic acid 6-phosphate etherase [Mobilicoccus pelagius NBRC 104925]